MEKTQFYKNKAQFYKNKLQEVLIYQFEVIIYHCGEENEMVQYVKIEEDEDLKILKIEIGIAKEISKKTKNTIEDYLRIFAFFYDITEKTKIIWTKI